MFSPEYPTNPNVENIYDTLDRVKEQKNVFGNSSFLYITGTRGEEVDQLGHSTIYTFSDSGKTLSQTDGIGRTVKMAYDAHDRLLTQTAPEGNLVTYVYDVNHNATTVTASPKPGCTVSCTPLVQQFVYELNPALGHYNKLKQATDALLRVTDYTYVLGTPNLQQVLQPLLTSSGGGRPTTSYTYTSKGRVTKYAYFPTGEAQTVTKNFGGLNLAENYVYDTRGNLTSLTDPRGFTTTYGYDVSDTC